MFYVPILTLVIWTAIIPDTLAVPGQFEDSHRVGIYTVVNCWTGTFAIVGSLANATLTGPARCRFNKLYSLVSVSFARRRDVSGTQPDRSFV